MSKRIKNWIYWFFYYLKKKGIDTSFYLDENFDFDKDISQISKLSNFNKSITVHRVKDIQTMQKLQLYNFFFAMINKKN